MRDTSEAAVTRSAWLAEAAARLRAHGQVLDVVEDLRVAGHAVRTRFADPALAAALGRATVHLRHPGSGTPDLTIDCWTEPDLSSRVPGAWPAIGTMHADDGALVLMWDAPDGPLMAYDRARRHGWAIFTSVAAIPVWDRATPFRRILHWWAAGHGMQFLHSAAVGHAGGGVLLVGHSGSGKSTTALACLEAGLGFVGDDHCLLAPGDPLWVHGLYLSAKGDANSARLLPRFSPFFARSPLFADGKSVLFADEVRPDGICAGFPLRGIVAPRVSREPVSRLSRLGRSGGFRTLTPSTVLEMPVDRGGSLARLAALTRNQPAWELTLGPDPAAAAQLIIELLTGQSAP